MLNMHCIAGLIRLQSHLFTHFTVLCNVIIRIKFKTSLLEQCMCLIRLANTWYWEGKWKILLNENTSVKKWIHQQVTFLLKFFKNIYKTSLLLSSWCWSSICLWVCSDPAHMIPSHHEPQVWATLIHVKGRKKTSVL